MGWLTHPTALNTSSPNHEELLLLLHFTFVGSVWVHFVISSHTRSTTVLALTLLAGLSFTTTTILGDLIKVPKYLFEYRSIPNLSQNFLWTIFLTSFDVGSSIYICDRTKQKRRDGRVSMNPPNTTPLHPGSTFIDGFLKAIDLKKADFNSYPLWY